MKNIKNVRFSDLTLDHDTVSVDGGSFPTDWGNCEGRWYFGVARDGDGDIYRVYWTNVNWAENEDDGCEGVDWNNPDYIFDDFGNQYKGEHLTFPDSF